MISHNTIDTTDILNYLAITGKDNQGNEISQWSEGMAYALYTNQDYHNLEGYILYYIYEVVVNNMKLNHFKAEGYNALLQYYSKGGKSYSVLHTEGNLQGRYIPVTGVRDVRELGEVHFKDFITKYMTSFISTQLKETSYRWTVGLTYQLDRVIQFIHFAVRSHMGILSEEGYQEIKETIIKEVHSNILEGTATNNKKVTEANGKFIDNSLRRSFELAESLG